MAVMEVSWKAQRELSTFKLIQRRLLVIPGFKAAITAVYTWDRQETKKMQSRWVQMLDNWNRLELASHVELIQWRVRQTVRAVLDVTRIGSRKHPMQSVRILVSNQAGAILAGRLPADVHKEKAI